MLIIQIPQAARRRLKPWRFLRAQDHYNYEFGKSAAVVCDHVYLVGKKQTEAIYKGLADGGISESAVTISESFIEAFNEASASPAEKIILIENDLPDNY